MIEGARFATALKNMRIAPDIPWSDARPVGRRGAKLPTEVITKKVRVGPSGRRRETAVRIQKLEKVVDPMLPDIAGLRALNVG